MIEGVAKYVGGKALSAAILVCAALAVIWYWNLPPEQKELIWRTVKGALVWVGFVAVLPWALFFVPAMVVKAESNLVSALALAGYLAVDVAFALYLTGGGMGGTLSKGVMILGFLAGAVYNFMVCEFLAQRSEDSC